MGSFADNFWQLCAGDHIGVGGRQACALLGRQKCRCCSLPMLVTQIHLVTLTPFLLPTTFADLMTRLLLQPLPLRSFSLHLSFSLLMASITITGPLRSHEWSCFTNLVSLASCMELLLLVIMLRLVRMGMFSYAP